MSTTMPVALCMCGTASVICHDGENAVHVTSHIVHALIRIFLLYPVPLRHLLAGQEHHLPQVPARLVLVAGHVVLRALRHWPVFSGGGVDHVEAIIEEAVARFTSGRLLVRLDAERDRVYRIVPERRATLEYYKNTVLHAFVPAAYVASAIRALGADVVDRPKVQALFRQQEFLLRHEFVLDPALDTDALEALGVRALCAYGALSADGTTVLDRARVGEIANLTANFLESYLLVLRAAERAERATTPMDLKSLAKDAMGFGKVLLAVDEIYRPEALSTQNLDNAVRAFKEEGVLSAVDGGLRIARGPFDTWVSTLHSLLLVPARDGEPASGSSATSRGAG